jgi:rhodanese-related sulfurtransferase
MSSIPYFITPENFEACLGTPGCPRLVDTRANNVVQASPGLIPGAVHLPEAGQIDAFVAALPPDETVVFACKAGHERSNAPAARWRAKGRKAQVLAGGYAAWTEAGFPLVNRAALADLPMAGSSVWVTRRRPKIDRVACPWLIRRFLDRDAGILFVDPAEVESVARAQGAIPFDIEGVAFSHDGPLCTFDTMLTRFGLSGHPVLSRLALIVRGADTARPDLAPQAAGLLAVSLGLSQISGDDDAAMLRHGFVIYDALYAWLRYAGTETHNWPSTKPV